MTRLVLVLGDQLSETLSALRHADKSADIVVMAETLSETGYVPHHPQKIVLVLAAMRKFAEHLRAAGWRVLYSRLDDPQTGPSIAAEIMRRAAETGATELICTCAGEFRVTEQINAVPLPKTVLEDDRFLCSLADFARWAEGRKALRMEYFYREMRRKTGYLMNGDTPEGGQWNFDHDNRKPAKGVTIAHSPILTPPCVVTEDVIALVRARFGDNFGTLDQFSWATDRDAALEQARYFINHALAQFGDFQDAMLSGNPTLFHALISPYMNIGLLSPAEVCEMAIDEYHAGRAPLNAVEGFVRQIIGWREYVRGFYFLMGPDYMTCNVLEHDQPLPALYWGAPTLMNCLSKVVHQTRDMAYAHHIQRLMVTGNFALLLGVSPVAVHEWYLSVYVDAFEWVEAPNTIGMSQFADGGILASKPYVSSGAYIDRMSDYCKGCSYKVSQKLGPKACPFNILYWDFLDRHRARFSGNPRMGNMYRTFDRFDADHQSAIRDQANKIRERLRAGEIV